jgi:outer membrane receptor protein involved in Fe transport
MPAPYLACRRSKQVAILAFVVIRASFAAEPPPAAEPGPIVTEIVVTGSRPDVQSRIDRRVYAVSGDLQADIGSAADVLRNVPSVSIDPDGNPSLRGGTDVQILVDGRFRPEFNGPNRGAALEQLAAGGIERIEVMTNPPARYKREGSSGIINIITRRTRGKHTGSAQASLGTGNRFNVSVNQGADVGPFNTNGSASIRQDRRIREITAKRVVRDGSGAIVAAREQRSRSDDDRLAKKISLSSEYVVSDNNRLGAEASYFRRDTDAVLNEDTRTADAAGAPLSRYTRERRSDQYYYTSDALLRWRRAGDSDDDFSVSLQRTDVVDRRPLHNAYLPLLPSASTEYQDQRWSQEALTTQFSMDYGKSWDGGRKLNTGYDLQRDNNAFDATQTIYAIEGEPRVPDPAFTNVFRFEQTIHALFATFELPVGTWTMLAGLRLEQAQLDMRQVTTAERSEQDYIRAYPSLHFSHKLNEQQMLTFSYARRVERPYWQAMNPYRLEYEANEFESGNPDLRPSIIDSVEAGWSRETGATSLNASVYGRRKRDSLTYVKTLLGTTATLNTTQNLGEDRAGGVELAASGKIVPRLGYSFSANVYYDEIDASNLGFFEKRSGVPREGKAALNWRLGEKDRLQLNVTAAGKQLTPQGYQLGSTSADLGYRHQFRPNLSLTATLSDAFATRRTRYVIDTPTLSERNTWRNNGRIGWIGITWTLVPASEKAQERFEYER